MMIDSGALARTLRAIAPPTPPRARGRDLERVGRLLVGVERRKFLWLHEPDWWYRRRVVRALMKGCTP